MILLVFTTNYYLASVTRRLSNFGDAVQWEDVEKKLHNCSSQRSWWLSSLDVHCSHHFTKKEKQTNKQIKKPTIAQLISVVQSHLPLVAERSPRISWSRLWANPPIIPTFDCLIVSPLLTVTSNNDCALLQLSIRRAIIFRGMGIREPDQASEPLAALFGNQPRTQAAELKIVSLPSLPDYNTPYLIDKSGTFCVMSVLSSHANAQPDWKIALTWSTRFVGPWTWMLLPVSEVGKSCLALQTNNSAESFFYSESCGARQELRRSKALFLPPPNKHIDHLHHNFKPSSSYSTS